MNIYEMYNANNYQYGFYVIRDSWATVIAQIIKIEGVDEGNEIYGKPPYYGNPKVFAEFYKVFDNEIDFAFKLCHSGCLIEVKELSCPGTYAYDLVE
jgi:hypothetical protein